MSAVKKRVRAKLGRQFRILSQFGSEKFHPGLRINLNGEEIEFVGSPEMDHSGVLLQSTRALANVFLEFKDGARVRFSQYPVVVKAGSLIISVEQLRRESEAA